MPIYHYLNVQKYNEVIISSEHPNTKEYYLVYSSTEHMHDMEQIIELRETIGLQGESIISVGEAKEHLNKSFDMLNKATERTLDFESTVFLPEYRLALTELYMDLEFYKDTDLLELKQCSSTYDSLLSKENAIIGFGNFWYNNQADEIHRKITALNENTVTPSALISSYTRHIPDEAVSDFLNGLLMNTNDNELTLGTSFIRENILKSDIPTSIPRKYFNEMAATFMRNLGLEDDSLISTNDPHALEFSRQLYGLHQEISEVIDFHHDFSLRTDFSNKALADDDTEDLPF